MILCRLLLSAVLAAQAVLGQNVSASTNTTRPLGTRAHHGLKPDGMQVNSIYVGVLPDWAHQSPIDINAALGKSIAIIGDYIYVTQNSRRPFDQMRYHSPDVIRLKDHSVYAPAVIPNFPLTSWTSEMSSELAENAAYYNTRGVPVWLRFAYEFNGEWMSYGLNPEVYKQKFREVAAAVRANTDCNSTYMVWAPNVAGGDVDSIRGYTPYWPGDDVVDMVGLSFYFSGRDKRENMMPRDNEFSSGFDSFYELYGSDWPVVIAETSAQYHYEIPSTYDQNGWDSEVRGEPNLEALTPVPNNNNVQELAVKRAWLEQMTGPETAGRYPNLTSVSIFNYFKEGNHSQFNDFRFIGGKSDVEAWTRSYVGNVTAYQGGFDGAASAARPYWTLLALTMFLFCAFL